MSDSLAPILAELHRLYNTNQPAMIARCEELLAQHPGFGPALMMLGLSAFYSRDEGLAIQFFEEAHEANPDCKEYVDILSTILPRAGRLNDSLYYAKLSVALTPDPELAPYVPQDLVSYRQALDEVAVSHHAMQANMALRVGDYDVALQRGDEELRINPHNVETLIVVARSLLGMGKARSAVNSLRAAAYIDSDNAEVHIRLAEALIACAQQPQAVEQMRLALELAGKDKSILGLAAGLSEWLDDSLYQATQDIRDRLESVIREGRGTKSPDAIPDTRMFGFVGDQFYDSPMAPFLIPVLKGFENSVLYRLNQRRDAVTTSFKHSVMRVRESADVDVFTLGRTMIGDQLNALFQLSPPSHESKYVNFKGPGAPPVVQWLSEPLADHLPMAELVVGDPQTRDADIATFGAERVITLDHMAACIFPDMPGPDEQITPLPRDANGAVTFGVFADLRRFTPQAIALWSRVLNRVKGSSLLVGTQSKWDDTTLQWLHEQFSDFGLGERIRLYAPDDGAMVSPLAFLGGVDIVLDATPVSSGHDVSRALWMGVPVVTLKGPRRASRFGASILAAAGCDQWITDQIATFVETAASLAEDQTLATIRSELRAKVLASRLNNPDHLRQTLNAAVLAAIAVGMANR